MQIILNAVYDTNNPESEKPLPPDPFFQNIVNALYSEQSHSVIPVLAKYYALPGQWIGVTPVHWSASHNDSMILGYGEALKLTESIARHYIKQFEDHLQDEKFEFYYHNPSLWLMRAYNKPPLNSPSPDKILHRSLMPIIECWDSKMIWVRLFTEVQMICASSSFTHIETDGLPMNGLWFWGAESIPPSDRVLISNDRRLVENLHPYLQTEFLHLNALKRLPDSIVVLNPVEQETLDQLKLLLQPHIRYFYNNYHVEHKNSHWLKRLWRRFV